MSIHSISNTIEQALAKAGLDIHSGPTKSALETIRRALEAARLAQTAPAQDSDEDSNTIDVDARGATAAAVDKLSNDLPDRLRIALEQHVGSKP